MRDKPDSSYLSPISITLIYLIVAGFWIYFSDQFLGSWIDDSVTLSRFQTYKGWFYVILTGIGLYLLIDKYSSNISKRNEILNFALRSARMATWEMNLETNRIYQSEFHHKLLGLSDRPAHMDKETFLSYVYPGDRKKIEEAHLDSIKHKKSYDIEFRIVWPDESIHWLRGRGKPNVDEQGNVLTLSGVIIDITEDKQLEESFRREQELFERIFQQIPVMITIYNPTLEEIRVNREFEKTIGYSTQDAQSIDLMKACYPNPDYRSEVIKFMKSPGPGWEEFTLTTKSGETVETSWTNISLSDDTQIGIGIDLTELKQSQARLRESERLLRKTFDSLRESVILIDPETRTIQDCNKVTEELFGYSKEELIGKTTRILHQNEEKFKKFEELGRTSLQQTGSFQTEYRMKRKNGELFYSDHIVTMVHDSKGEVEQIVSVIRDITEKKKTEERIIRSSIEGEDRERKRVARELHDGLGQYLSAASMYLESVKSEVDQLPEKRREQFGSGLKFLKHAISETRDIAHNLMPSSIDDYGLETALETLIDNLERNTEVSFKFFGKIAGIDLEPQKALNLYRITQEALNNAIRHGECSSISVEIGSDERNVSLSIEDDGKRFNPDDKMDSKGLGIRSIKNRVRSMSGTVHIKSTPGKGSKVFLKVPLDTNSNGG